MKLKEYVEHSPERISRNVSAIARQGLVKTIVTPTIFHSADDKILFVGDLGKRKLKLPNEFTVLSREKEEFDIDAIAKNLAGFCFKGSGGVEVVNYLGLIRHKPQDKTLIIPVVATLEDRSESPWLAPSSIWLEHTIRNSDHLWVDNGCRRLIDGSDSDMLTENTAGIVDYFQSTSMKSPV